MSMAFMFGIHNAMELTSIHQTS